VMPIPKLSIILLKKSSLSFSISASMTSQPTAEPKFAKFLSSWLKLMLSRDIIIFNLWEVLSEDCTTAQLMLERMPLDFLLKWSWYMDWYSELIWERMSNLCKNQAFKREWEKQKLNSIIRRLDLKRFNREKNKWEWELFKKEGLRIRVNWWLHLGNILNISRYLKMRRKSVKLWILHRLWYKIIRSILSLLTLLVKQFSFWLNYFLQRLFKIQLKLLKFLDFFILMGFRNQSLELRKCLL
jgi:hypothetical protein